MSIVKRAQARLTPEQQVQVRARAEAFIKEAQKDSHLMGQAHEKLGGFFGNAWKGLKGALGSSEKAVGTAVGEAPGGLGHAFGTQFGRALPGTLAASAIAGGLAFATGAGEKAVSDVHSRVQKVRSYRDMMEANPNLKEFDPVMVQRAFSTLHRFNPAYASDPLVAGTFVATTADQARMDTRTVDSLVQARRGMADGSGGNLDFFRSMLPKTMNYDQNAENRLEEAHAGQMGELGRNAELHPGRKTEQENKATEFGWKEEDRPELAEKVPYDTIIARYKSMMGPHELTTAEYRAQMGPHDLQSAMHREEEASNKAQTAGHYTGMAEDLSDAQREQIERINQLPPDEAFRILNSLGGGRG